MEAASQSNDQQGNSQFLYDSPVHSALETKLKHLILKLAAENKILGIQERKDYRHTPTRVFHRGSRSRRRPPRNWSWLTWNSFPRSPATSILADLVCAYKDGKVIIDTAAGVLGLDDPRPVQHDSLFPVFSVTKGIVAGMVHWLVENGKLKFDDNVAKIWPGFGINNKESIKVHHVLNHTSGLHNALSAVFMSPSLIPNWKECLNTVVASIPESEPGKIQLYHYSSFGWLCGGIIEHASGKTFHEVLNEAIVRPLNIEDELYIGIPSGVESRLASLTPDMEELKIFLSEGANMHQPDLPDALQLSAIVKSVPIYANLYNSLEIRRAIVPSVNGHFTARALARYYATLAAGGIVPPLYTPRKDTTNNNSRADSEKRIFHNPKIHDAFMGLGDYKDLAIPDGVFGLGFSRHITKDGPIGFGHAGLGGSVGLCDINHNFSIAVTVNKMSIGAVTGHIVHLVCSELNIPVPEDYAGYGDKGADIKLH